MKRIVLLTVFIFIALPLICQDITRWYQPYDQYKLYKKCKSDQGTYCLVDEETIEVRSSDGQNLRDKFSNKKPDSLNYSFKKILYFNSENQMVKMRFLLPIKETEKITLSEIIQRVLYRDIAEGLPIFTEISGKTDKEITIDITPVKYRINVLMGKAQNLTGCKLLND